MVRQARDALYLAPSCSWAALFLFVNIAILSERRKLACFSIHTQDVFNLTTSGPKKKPNYLQESEDPKSRTSAMKRSRSSTQMGSCSSSSTSLRSFLIPFIICRFTNERQNDQVLWTSPDWNQQQTPVEALWNILHLNIRFSSAHTALTKENHKIYLNDVFSHSSVSQYMHKEPQQLKTQIFHTS